MTGDRSNERHPTTGSFDFQQDRDTSRADRYWARTHFKCTDAGVPIGGTSEMKVGDPFGYQSDPPMTAVRKPIPFGGLQLGLYQRRWRQRRGPRGGSKSSLPWSRKSRRYTARDGQGRSGDL